MVCLGSKRSWSRRHVDNDRIRWVKQVRQQELHEAQRTSDVYIDGVEDPVSSDSSQLRMGRSLCGIIYEQVHWAAVQSFSQLRAGFEPHILLDRYDARRPGPGFQDLGRARVSMANSLCPWTASRNARWWP